jgi:anti-sigma factor RsiW
MTTPTACPDFSSLSQFFDRELEPEEQQKIGYHIATCPTCHPLLARLEHVEELMRKKSTTLSSGPNLESTAQECLSPELVSAYMQQELPLADGARVESHLQQCDMCLSEVREAFQIVTALTSAKRELVPAVLKARVAALWQETEKQEEAASFSRLVIQATKRGLQLLEQHLTFPFLEMQQMFVPMPVYRAEDGPSALRLNLTTGQATIRVTAVQEGRGAALKLTFFDAKQEAIAGQRIFLRQQGRAIFSAKTDEEGVLRTPHLEPGTYEVACFGMNTNFQLELRA